MPGNDGSLKGRSLGTRISTGCDYIDQPISGYDTIEEGEFAVLRIAENGRNAAELMKQTPFDLIVLGMIMVKDFDGHDTYRQIIKLRTGKPCVIASGFSESDRVKEAQQLGVGAYVRKPYALEKLSRAVRIELDSEQIKNIGPVSST